jgi:hypothetical protein
MKFLRIASSRIPCEMIRGWTQSSQAELPIVLGESAEAWLRPITAACEPTHCASKPSPATLALSSPRFCLRPRFDLATFVSPMLSEAYAEPLVGADSRIPTEGEFPAASSPQLTAQTDP